MVREFPTKLGPQDNGTAAGLERWLYLTQALQTRCVGGSVTTYRQHAEVMVCFIECKIEATEALRESPSGEPECV